MKWKSGVINRLPIAIPLFFKGLYLVGKREETNALPGIALALSMNRKLIRLHRQGQIPSDEREKGKRMKKKDSLSSTLGEVMVRIAIGAIFAFMGGFNYWFRQV